MYKQGTWDILMTGKNQLNMLQALNEHAALETMNAGLDFCFPVPVLELECV